MTRTITTLEERWALPRGTVIRDAAGVAWVKHPNSWRATTPIEHDQWIVLPATVLHDPSVPAPSEATPPVMRIEGTWLAEFVDEHTCGAGPGSGTGMHEPGCGLVPVLDLATLPGWDEHLTAAPSVVPEAAVESALFEVERRLRQTDGYSAEDVRRMALLHIDAYREGRARIVCEHQPAQSATREEVADVAAQMHPSLHEPLRTKVGEAWADALLARYNMTRKEGR